MSVLLSDLKGAQLAIIVALWITHIHGLSNLSNKALAFETGYHDSKTLAEALLRLSRRGLVVCLGNPANRNEWALTAACRQMFLPAEPAAIESRENPTSLPEVPSPTLSPAAETRENPDSLFSAGAKLTRDSGESGKSQVSLPESESVKLIDDSGDTESGHRPLFGSAWTAEVQHFQASHLEQKYLQALRAGKVYHQLCGPLAKQLAAEGPEYLAHLLGFVAYAYGPDCDQSKPGAVVYPAARDRDPCDPRYLPPRSLNFEQALAWAARGGREAAPAPVAASMSEAAEKLEALPPELTAARQVWAKVLAQLQLELTRDVFTTWLVGTTLLAATETLYTVGARHTYARDWLETRLKQTIKHALENIVGHAVDVEFVVLAPSG